MRIVLLEHGVLQRTWNCQAVLAAYLARGFTRCVWCYALVSSSAAEHSGHGSCPNCGSGGWRH